MSIAITVAGREETVEQGEYLLTVLRRLGKRIPALPGKAPPLSPAFQPEASS